MGILKDWLAPFVGGYDSGKRDFLKLVGFGGAGALLASCVTPPTPDMDPNHLKDLEALKPLPDVELIKLHIPDLDENEKVIIRGFLKGHGLDVDRFDQGNVEIWLPGAPDPSDPEKKKKKFLFAGVLRETSGRIDTRFVAAGRMLVRHATLQKNLDIPVFMQTGPDGRLVGVSLAQTLGPDELSSTPNRQRDYRIVRATLDEKGVVVPDPQQLILQYSVAPGFQGPSSTVVGTQVYALDMNWNNLTKPPLRVYGDTALATEQQFAALTKPATHEYTSNLLSPSDARIEKMIPTSEEGLREAAKKAGIAVEKAVFNKVHLETFGGERSKDAIVIFDPTKSTSIVEGIALEGEYFSAVKRTSTSGAETTVNISLKDANLGTDGKTEYWEIKRLAPVFEREKKRIVFGDGDPIQLTLEVNVNEKGPVPTAPDKMGDMMISGMSATFGSVILQLEKALKLFGDGVEKILPGVKEVKEIKRNIIFEKDFYPTESELLTAFHSVDTSAYELRGPSNRRYVFYATGPGYETFQNRFSVDIVRAVMVAKVQIEQLPDGKQIAHFLLLSRKTKENDPFTMRVSVPFEQVLVSQGGVPGIDSIQNLSQDARLNTLDRSIIPQENLFRVKISSPVTKSSSAGQPTLSDSVFRVFSVGYQNFVRDRISSPLFKPFVNYEEFMNIVISQWRKIASASFSDENIMFQMLNDAGKQWVDSPSIPELSLPDSVYVEPVFSTTPQS